jgi:alpha-tubulin suppressor-like RCC1 family protein
MLKLYKPMVVYSAEVNNNLITQIDTGNHFSGFLTEQGAVYTFGSNTEGQLGIGMDEIPSVWEP